MLWFKYHIVQVQNQHPSQIEERESFYYLVLNVRSSLKSNISNYPSNIHFVSIQKITKEIKQIKYLSAANVHGISLQDDID